jgi:hypothetical protein
MPVWRGILLGRRVRRPGRTPSPSVSLGRTCRLADRARNTAGQARTPPRQNSVTICFTWKNVPACGSATNTLAPTAAAAAATVGASHPATARTPPIRLAKQSPAAVWRVSNTPSVSGWATWAAIWSVAAIRQSNAVCSTFQPSRVKPATSAPGSKSVPVVVSTSRNGETARPFGASAYARAMPRRINSSRTAGVTIAFGGTSTRRTPSSRPETSSIVTTGAFTRSSPLLPGSTPRDCGAGGACELPPVAPATAVAGRSGLTSIFFCSGPA